MGKSGQWAQMARTRATQLVCKRIWEDAGEDDERFWCYSGPMDLGYNLKAPKPVIAGKAVSGVGRHPGLTEGFAPEVVPVTGPGGMAFGQRLRLPGAVAPNVGGAKGHGWHTRLDRPVPGRLGLVIWVGGTPNIRRRGNTVMGSQFLYETVRQALADAGEEVARASAAAARAQGLSHGWGPSEAWLDGVRVRLLLATDAAISLSETPVWGTSRCDRGIYTNDVIAKVMRVCDREGVDPSTVEGIARLKDFDRREAKAVERAVQRGYAHKRKDAKWIVRVEGGMQRTVLWDTGDRPFREGFINPDDGWRATAWQSGGRKKGYVAHGVGDVTVFVGQVSCDVKNDRLSPMLTTAGAATARLSSGRVTPQLWRPSYAGTERGDAGRWEESVALDIGGWHAVAKLPKR